MTSWDRTSKAVDECHYAQMYAGRVCLCRTGAVGLQALLHNPQENKQRRIECTLIACR